MKKSSCHLLDQVCALDTSYADIYYACSFWPCTTQEEELSFPRKVRTLTGCPNLAYLECFDRHVGIRGGSDRGWGAGRRPVQVSTTHCCLYRPVNSHI